MSGAIGFTPGPWTWDPDGYGLRPSQPDPDAHNVHTIHEGHLEAYGFINTDWRAVDAETATNRRLIAASPLLFEALAEAEAFIAGFEGDPTQPGVDEILSQIRAALSLVHADGVPAQEAAA